jgi:hypothetical protein
MPVAYSFELGGKMLGINTPGQVDGDPAGGRGAAVSHRML